VALLSEEPVDDAARTVAWLLHEDVEGRLDRVQEAFDRGIRSLQLVHYRINELGDIQTAAPIHGGLTDFGRAAVKEMNRLGIIVDVAHATQAVVAGVAEDDKEKRMSNRVARCRLSMGDLNTAGRVWSSAAAATPVGASQLGRHRASPLSPGVPSRLPADREPA